MHLNAQAWTFTPNLEKLRETLRRLFTVFQSLTKLINACTEVMKHVREYYYFQLEVERTCFQYSMRHYTGSLSRWWKYGQMVKIRVTKEHLARSFQYCFKGANITFPGVTEYSFNGKTIWEVFDLNICYFQCTLSIAKRIDVLLESVRSIVFYFWPQ